MLKWMVVVLGLQFVGELSASLLELPIPGPVIGMILLFLLLLKLGGLPKDLNRLADGLLSNLYLYFIPATVGVTTHIALISNQWLPIVTAVVVSSVLAMIVAGWIMQGLAAKDDDDAV
jgi:putative effector of murein hydrolase LrgA (UPF0299 family)